MIKTIKLIIVTFVFSRTTYAVDLIAGKKYELIKPIYIMGIYNDLNERIISRNTATAYLETFKLANKSYTAFHQEVPVGTVITILGIASKPWYLYFNTDHYLVTLSPDISRGLEVKLPIDDAFKGSLDGLNPEIFKPVEQQ